MTEGTFKRRSADAIVLDLILFGFVGTIVALSLVGLGPEARLVPLIIGVPTLVGITGQLLLDVFPGVRLGWKDAGDGDTGEKGEAQPSATGAASDSAQSIRGATRRKFVFSAWAVGFVVLSAVFGFLVSIPLALLFFFRVVAREGWILTLSLTGGAWAFVWLLFGVLLNVEL